jgi:Mycothiol maleylpyruvate isomerase N-terminal domain
VPEAETAGWTRLTAAVRRAGGDAAGALAWPEVAARWDEPSVLPEMTVGGLASHLAQMLTGLVAWLEAEPPGPGELAVQGLYETYGHSARLDGERGLEGDTARTIRTWAAERAGDGPVATAAAGRTAVDRLAALLDLAEPDRVIPSVVLPGVGMRLDDYLRTRCIEFVVHTLDLAASVGRAAPEPAPEVGDIVVTSLVALCRVRAGDAAVVTALTRRERSDPEALRAL